MTLPLGPPVKPQLAKSAKELPQGDEWCYEPKFDGFRTIVFRDGEDVHLQSRNGKPMNRYFPDVVEQVLELPHDRLVLDGEMMVVVDGVQEFDLLSQRIHPAASRVERLREETPAELVAFDLLAEGDEVLCSLPYTERRERLAAVVSDPVQLTPMTPDPDDADHQRKLMQREYYGSRRWRRLFKRRALVEGVFGILKNASRQRLRRGQNRLPGLAITSIVAAVKASVFNEEQLHTVAKM